MVTAEIRVMDFGFQIEWHERDYHKCQEKEKKVVFAAAENDFIYDPASYPYVNLNRFVEANRSTDVLRFAECLHMISRSCSRDSVQLLASS
jgi:hypothetical protein